MPAQFNTIALAMRRGYSSIMKAISVILVAGLLSACSSTEVVAPTMNVSVGRQLIDLKKAKDSGALSQKEWEQQKKRLIDSVR
jgi:hypothetical protein